MRNMIIIRTLTILAAVLIFTAGQASAVEFTAVLFSIHPNGDVYPKDTLTPNLWVKDSAYRYEGNYQERPIIIISDKAVDSAWFLDVGPKTYLPVKRSEGGVPDPIQMWNAFFATCDIDTMENQTLHGYDCRRFKFTAPNGVWAHQWVSDSLGYYIKLITHYSEKASTTVELVNIKEEPVDASLFELPEDYVNIHTIPLEERPQQKIKVPAGSPGQ